jgi:hypothetical protein
MSVREERMYAKEKLEEALYFVLQMRNSHIDKKHFVYNRTISHEEIEKKTD